MGLFKSFVSQTRKPEGVLGKMMLKGMNPGHAQMADWGLSHLPVIHPEEITDLGCGGGRNAGELLRMYPQAHVTAVDYSELSVEKAGEYNQNMIASGRCSVRQGDVSDLDLPPEQYELATAFETIYFWPGLEKCFAQVYKVLKPGGLFLICNESDGKDAASQKFEKIIDGMKIYTAEKIRKALEAAGFSEMKIDHHPSKPWITILAKNSKEVYIRQAVCLTRASRLSIKKWTTIKLHKESIAEETGEGGRRMRNGYWIAVAAASLLMTPRVRPRNQMKLPSFHGIAEVRASIPGRIRLYMPAVTANPEAAAQMKKQMEETGAVHEVRINPSTGSVLFLYDEQQVEASVVEGAAIRLMGLDEAIQRQPVSKMEKNLQTLWSSIDHGVMETTKGWMDARMLAGTALSVAAIRSLITNGAVLPGGITLLWWASSIFSRNRHD